MRRQSTGGLQIAQMTRTCLAVERLSSINEGDWTLTPIAVFDPRLKAGGRCGITFPDGYTPLVLVFDL